MAKVAAILVSGLSIPFEKIGSWPHRYTKLVKSDYNPFDYVISPLDAVPESTNCVKYVSVAKYPFRKWNKIFKRKGRGPYTQQLRQIIKNHDYLIISVVDNYKILFEIIDWVKAAKLQQKVKLIFSICGQGYYMSVQQELKMYDNLSEFVFLTNSAYQFNMARVPHMSCEVSVITNGVDDNVFFSVTQEKKTELRKQKGIDDDKLVFFWCSQDRPKKGLHIVLEAWKDVIMVHDNVELIIAGTHKVVKGSKIKWIGRLPNQELATYYQLCDFYLFPTLFVEGHPLSLTEALKSGAYCISSDKPAMREVLKDGELGQLVSNPNIVENWVKGINHAITVYNENGRKNIYLNKLNNNLYSLEYWFKNSSNLINKWKKRLN